MKTGIKRVMCFALTFLMLFGVTSSELAILNALENTSSLVSLNTEKSDLKIGEKTNVKAETNLPSGAEIISYDWAYDESILKVNDNGQYIEVEALTSGKSKITVVVNYQVTVIKENENQEFISEVVTASETAETEITVVSMNEDVYAQEQSTSIVEDSKNVIKATKEVETESSDEDVAIDPIATEYIRSHIDKKYANADKFVFSNILLVKNTLAEANKLADNETIDTLMAREDIEEVFISTIPTTVAMYNTDETSEYYVAVADTMKNDKTATIIDHCFAINNNNGEVLNNCHYDSATGLVYVPKAYFKNDSGVEVVNNVQVQFLQSISNDVNNITSKVKVATVDGNDMKTGNGKVEAFDFETKVKTEKNLSKSELTVAINGVPLSGEKFDYNSKNGTVTVGASSSGVDTVTVDVDEKGIVAKAIDKVLNITEVNAASSFSSMNLAGTVTVPAGVGKGWSGHVTLFKAYASDWKTPTLPVYGYSTSETALVNLIHGGGNLDYSRVSAQTTYMNLGVMLQAGNDGNTSFQSFWDWSIDGATGVTQYDAWLRLQCTHVSNPEGTNGVEWKNESIRIRVLDENNDEIVIGFLTKQRYGQSGAGIAKFKKRQQNGALAIQKVSANPSVSNGNPCYSLSGAEYQLRDLSNNTVATLVTNNEGKASVGDIKAGNYNLVETRASAGFELNTTVTPVTITAGQTTTLNGNGCLSETPANDPVTIQITKNDKDNGVSNPQGNASLEGAEFTVKYYNNLYDKISDLPVDATRTWVLKTKKQANGSFKAYLLNSYKVSGDDFFVESGMPTLPIGTITIQETKAPDGYLLEGATLVDGNGNNESIDNNVYLTQIKQNDVGTTASVVAGNYPVVSDYVKKQKVEIEKVSQDRHGVTAPLNGATFTIKLKSEVAEKGWDNATVYDQVTTSNFNGQDGYAVTKDLPFGTYIIRETGTPAGYVRADDIEFKIDKDQSEMTAIQHFKFTNKETHIQLYKYDVETSDALKDAEYLIYNVTADKEVGRYKTNDQGIIDLYKLAGGNVYYAQEVKAPNGYEVNDTKFYFEFDRDGYVKVSDLNSSEVDKNVFTINSKGDMKISLSNKLKYFKLNLNKINDVKRKLEGAEFTLYKDKECTQEIMKGTTDTDGNLKFNQVEVGTYYLKETKAPAGYRKLLDSIKVEFRCVNKKHTFYVNDQAITTPNDNYSMTIENEWHVGNMTIENQRGSKLPATGSSMTLIIVGAGLAICLAGIFNRKKLDDKGEN